MTFFINRCFRLGCALALTLVCLPGFSQAATPAAAADEAAIHTTLSRIEKIFAAGDLEAAMTLFTDDAIILADDGADIAGAKAIRAAYAEMIQKFKVDTKLSSVAIKVSGDLAVEHGTYTLKLTDKASGQVALDAHRRYLHVYKRQADGGWKTWRMMTNDLAAPTP